MSPAAHLLRLLIRAYQLVLSPLVGPTCRFGPSCSAYAAEAVAVHGAVKGGWLAAKRLGRCHPWGGSGYDPVPAKETPISSRNPADVR
ncbi:MAG: membrane protein insertion efficiency factor YidD [Alphaproteobacteria bacterium]|nr:membrane protein insertion efficiency factor YidD [Alphaproteobacteria bacterium]